MCVCEPRVYAFTCGEIAQHEQESGGQHVKTPETGTASLAGNTPSECTEQLARFFPDAKPVQVRAILTPLPGGSGRVRESVLVEFASAEKAIFSSALPLEFDDRVCLRQADGNHECTATVVAVQYHQGRKAVAVQFADGQGSWVKRP